VLNLSWSAGVATALLLLSAGDDEGGGFVGEVVTIIGRLPWLAVLFDRKGAPTSVERDAEERDFVSGKKCLMRE